MNKESSRCNGLVLEPPCTTWPPLWLAEEIQPPPSTPPRVETELNTSEPQYVVSPSDLPPDLYEYWRERAGIRQFDGGLSVEQAEALALADVLREADLPAAEEAATVVQATLFAVERSAGPYVRGL